MPHLSKQQQNSIEEHFIALLNSQLLGLQNKVENDFSKENFEKELQKLRTDSVYPAFSLDTVEYVLIRLMGRLSISIGRRIGEIYDKIPRFVAAARFGLEPQQVAPTIGSLQLDIGLRFSQLVPADILHAKQTIKGHVQSTDEYKGIGIEIRFNFNPNDSARLRKDVEMGDLLREEGFLPIYLIFSTISPRDEAIKRLERSGWTFLVGERASSFSKELFGLDMARTLDSPEVKANIKSQVQNILEMTRRSYAFKAVAERTKPR